MPFFEHFKKLIKEPAFAATLAAPVVGAGIGLAAEHRRKMREAKAKAESYRTMMDLHPKLKSHDQKEIGRLFNSLHNVNPILARDPLVAGAWIDNIMDNKSTLGTESSHQQLLAAVKDLAGIRAQLSQSLKNERPSTAPNDRAHSFVMDAGKALHEAEHRGIQDFAAQKNREIDEHFDGEHNIMMYESGRLADQYAAEGQRLEHMRQQLQEYAKDLQTKHSASDNELEQLFGALDL